MAPHIIGQRELLSRAIVLSARRQNFHYFCSPLKAAAYTSASLSWRPATFSAVFGAARRSGRGRSPRTSCDNTPVRTTCARTFKCKYSPCVPPYLFCRPLGKAHHATTRCGKTGWLQHEIYDLTREMALLHNFIKITGIDLQGPGYRSLPPAVWSGSSECCSWGSCECTSSCRLSPAAAAPSKAIDTP
jgi:hypothetical protein